MLTYVYIFGRTIKGLGRAVSPFSFRFVGVSLPTLTLELTMDTDKYKSIAVGIETWRKLNELAKENYRSVGGTITYLTEKEYYS